MKLDAITLHGFMTYRAPVTLDLTQIPEGLVAIVGPNGGGKSTLLESPFAALHREWPSRGDLAPYATGKDSYLEATFSVAGRGRYCARVNVDGVRRTSDAVLEVTPDGGPPSLLNDGKATTYDRVIRETFPSRELMLASCFAAQNQTGNFITCKPSQRRELFGELLGLTALTTMGQTAKTLAGLIEQTRGRLVAVRDVLARDTSSASVATLEGAQEANAEDRAAATTRQAALAAELEQLEAQLATMGDAVAAHGAVTQRMTALRQDLATRQAEHGRIETDTQKAAAALDREVVAINARETAALAGLNKKLQGNAQIQAMAADIRAAVAQTTRLDALIPRMRAAVDAALEVQRRESAALHQVEQQLAQMATSAQRLERATLDAALLKDVPCGGAGDFAGCRFLVNAERAKAELETLAQALAPRAALADEVGARRRAEDDAATDAAAHRAVLTSAEAERATHAEAAGYAAKLDASEARVRELSQMMADAVEQTSGARKDARQRYAAAVGDLTDRSEALAAIIATLTTDLQAAEHERDALQDGNAAATALQGTLRARRLEWDRVTGALAAAEATRADLERRQDELEAKRQELAGLETRIAALETELLDWQLLAKALGKDGLPELEIDAAGPTISAYTNELLAECHGTRFSLELVTQVAKADGKGMKSDFTVEVTDNANGGTARDIADLSGGEQVVVAEALRNAIALYAARRSAMPVRTAWKDETTGALDPENAVRYVQMLRKVHEMGGYAHTLFITHNPEVAALADAQVRVADGQITVALPPYTDPTVAA